MQKKTAKPSKQLRFESLETREMLTAIGEAPFDYGQTFLLHSKPDSHYTVYLDFDGHTTTNLLWNKDCTNGAPIVTPAFTIDSDVNHFSNAELERIQYIWARVAEDYISFDVDITTEEPSPDRLIKSKGGDADWGTRVVIGGDSSWYGHGGGVAYIDSFDMDSDTPCFVFSQELGNEEKRVAEAVSHETGHTLGLHHDGTTNPRNEYYAGANGWAPIMGTGYYQSMTQWSKGEYDQANNKEDDLAIISRHIPYRTDDHGDTIKNASILEISDETIYQSGIIERNTDYDFFSFAVTERSHIQLNVASEVREPNLDIKAQLYDQSGKVLAVSNSDYSLWASFSEDLTPGTYFISVTGDGKPGVYSDYGSLGSYTISGSVVELQILDPVASLELLDTTSNTATFAWEAVPKANTYRIERSNDGATGWSNIGTSTASEFTDTGLSRGIDYYYRVIAVGTSIEANPSQVLKVRTGELPEAFIYDSGNLIVQEGCVLTLSARGSYDPFGEELRYFWDLYGTGEFTEAIESVNFSAAGYDGKPGELKTVRLKVVSSDGTESGVVETGVSIEDVPPSIKILPPDANELFAGNLTIWTVRTSDVPADYIQHWNIDWGDGSIFDQPGCLSEKMRFFHRYAKPGIYPIKITVTDDDSVRYTIEYFADVISLQEAFPELSVGATGEHITTKISQTKPVLYEIVISESLAEHDYYYSIRDKYIWTYEFVDDLLLPDVETSIYPYSRKTDDSSASRLVEIHDLLITLIHV